jgi:hypothetical protein
MMRSIQPIATIMMSRTYKTAASSLGLLNTSKPPNFHSPDGDIKMELMRMLPCVDAHESFMNAKATCRILSREVRVETWYNNGPKFDEAPIEASPLVLEQAEIAMFEG